MTRQNSRLFGAAHRLQWRRICGKLNNNLDTTDTTKRGNADRSARQLGGSSQWMYAIPQAAANVSSGSTQTMRGLLSKTSLQKDVAVDMKDGVAAVTVHIIPYYGSKVMDVCKKVQENVKQTIQIMTGITVSRVNVVAAGLAEPKAADAE